MILPTYAQLLAKIKNDNDLSGESFISDNEMLGYLNEAIKNAAKIINVLGYEDKYFMSAPATLNLVNGAQTIALPADIYANKIRKLFYVNGTRIYEIRKIRRLVDIPFVQAGDDYLFEVFFPTGQLPLLYLYPTPAENGAFLQMYYIRGPKLMDATSIATNVMEIPESENAIYAHIMWNVAKKSKNATMISNAKADLNEQVELMESVLADMFPDENNKVQMDLSAYYDQEMNLYT